MSNLRTIRAQEGLIKQAKLIDFDAEARRINRMTDRNDHNGSLVALLEMLDFKKDVKVMEHVQAIHKIMGSMPYDLIRFRHSLLKKAYEAAKQVKMPNGETFYDLLD